MARTDQAGRPVVVVTGMGVVTSLGAGREENWQKLTAGESGIREITRFSTDGLKTRIAGSVDFVPLEREILTTYEAGSIQELTMHDGSTIHLHKLQKDWDPTDRMSAVRAIGRARAEGEILTGLLYIDESSTELHDLINTTDMPLNTLGKDVLCPGSEALAKLNETLR